MDTLRNDLRLAFRNLLKNPGFTFVAVLTLALGIAVNATMFSLVSAFLLRRPPVDDPGRIVVVSTVDPGRAFQPDATRVSTPNYLAWRAANDVFAEMAAVDESRRVSLAAAENPAQAERPATAGESVTAGAAASAGAPESIYADVVSQGYFHLIGVSPRLGRAFADEENQAGRDHVIILSHALWQRRFGGDPAVLGRAVRVNRENYTVIGVMPASFKLMGSPVEAWLPLVIQSADSSAAARRDRWLLVMGRLKPGKTLADARAEFTTFGRRTAEQFPETEKGWGVAVRTLPDFLIYDFSIRSALAIVMTTVGFVLMIACANVAGLLLARAAGRRRELAIRLALGAGRMRLVRQLLTESLVIALIGGAGGLLLSIWGIPLVRAGMQFNAAVSAVDITLDRNVLLFSTGISLLCTVLCGLAPALAASRTDINTSLKTESRAATAGHGQSRLRSILVTAEIALALFLLIGSGLLMRTIYMLQHQDLGFEPGHLLTAAVNLDSARYKGGTEQTAFAREVISRLEQIPGVDSAAVTTNLPATGPSRVTLRIEGQADLPENQRLSALDSLVSAQFFRAAGIPVLRGRAFTEMDNATAPRVVVVNQQFVHINLKDGEALGRRIRLEVGGTAQDWSEIVGIVGDVKTYAEGEQVDPEVYESFAQRPAARFALMIRARSDPGGLAGTLRDAVAQVDAELPLARLWTMQVVIERQRGGDRVFTYMLGTFAALALVLAAVGLYGLIAYSVRQRTHEIGVRIALGAQSRQVLRLILGQGMKMAAIGSAIGCAAALPLPKVFEAMFYDLHVADPGIYVVLAATILTVAMLAALVPAVRASRVDPMSALREE